MKKNILNNKDENLFISLLIDKINFVNSKNIAINTDFLDLNLFNIAVPILNKYKCKYYVFDFNNLLERKVIFIIPNDDNFEINLDIIKCLEIKNASYKNIILSHKDYMGALYNLGVNNEKFSDIFVQDNKAYVFVIDDVIVKYIEYNLDRIGKAVVNINVISDFENVNIKREFNNLNIKILSLRLDLFISKLCNLSRNDSSDKINKNEVVINSKINNNKIYDIKIGDIIAIRKYGKFIIKNITFKNKYIINIDKYK